jgi:hypothetical protein
MAALSTAVGAGTLQRVQNYYGKVLSTSKDLKTSACTAAGRPHPLIRQALKEVPEEVKSKFYGCGAPLPLGIDGLRVLDLGSGSGRDCYVASKLVGERGTSPALASLCKVEGHERMLRAISETSTPFLRLQLDAFPRRGELAQDM